MGVVNIKKILIFILISVMFITISAVSAENVTDTASINMEDTTINEVSSYTEIIKKENNVTKESTSTTKTASKISIDSQSVKYNTTTNFNAKVTDVKGNNINEGKVVFKINGRTIGTTLVDQGIASLSYDLTDMTPKEYNLTVKYGENSKYLESSASSILTLLKHDSKITVNNVSVITRNTFNITANVIDSETGNLATGGKVAFKINGKTIGYANVSKGMVSYSYSAMKLSAKLYNITASYGGDHFLNSDVSQKAILNVSAIPTRMSVSKVSGYSNSVVLKATVVEKSNSNYLPSGIVVFKINDKTVGNSTISDGKVSFTYNTTQLARGTYKITAMLKPTSTFAESSASNNLTILAEEYFTFNQIKSAAVDVRNQFESNHTVTTVYIGKSRIALSEFLALMIQSAKNINNGKSSEKIPYKFYKTVTTQKDSVTSGYYTISQVLEIGDRVYAHMQKYNKPPTSISTVRGTLGYFNLVYTYARIFDVTSSSYLPTPCTVYNWESIHPSNSKSRTIYISSDVVYNLKDDYAFMYSIKSKLESYGYTVKIGGYGPNEHCDDIWDKSLPKDAVQVSIFSGADAGVIYDICTRSFMRTKENRLMFLVFYSETSADITGMKFLKRAHDDNYSSSSFTGIAYPDIYLKSHGYDYAFASNPEYIAKSVIKYIT